MLDFRITQQILRDVVTDTPPSESIIPYGAEELAYRDKIALEVASHPAVPHSPHEFPEFTDEEWQEVLAEKRRNDSLQ